MSGRNQTSLRALTPPASLTRRKPAGAPIIQGVGVCVTGSAGEGEAVLLMGLKIEGLKFLAGAVETGAVETEAVETGHRKVFGKVVNLTQGTIA